MIITVHLADDRGVPMHAVANAMYWGGFSASGRKDVWQQMVPDDDYGRRTLETDDTGLVWAPETFASHLRVSVEQGRELRAYVANDESKHYSAAMAFVCKTLESYWQTEADAALAAIHEAADYAASRA